MKLLVMFLAGLGLFGITTASLFYGSDPIPLDSISFVFPASIGVFLMVLSGTKTLIVST